MQLRVGQRLVEPGERHAEPVVGRRHPVAQAAHLKRVRGLLQGLGPSASSRFVAPLRRLARAFGWLPTSFICLRHLENMVKKRVLDSQKKKKQGKNILKQMEE